MKISDGNLLIVNYTFGCVRFYFVFYMFFYQILFAYVSFTGQYLNFDWSCYDRVAPSVRFYLR